MYIIDNITYADAGKYLVSGNKSGYTLLNDPDIIELDVNLEDIRVIGTHISYNNGRFRIKYVPEWNYADYKKYIIKMRYSNDDQIAIILNRYDSESDQIRYDRMMMWREFASKLAAKIVNK